MFSVHLMSRHSLRHQQECAGCAEPSRPLRAFLPLVAMAFVAWIVGAWHIGRELLLCSPFGGCRDVRRFKCAHFW